MATLDLRSRSARNASGSLADAGSGRSAHHPCAVTAWRLSWPWVLAEYEKHISKVEPHRLHLQLHLPARERRRYSPSPTVLTWRDSSRASKTGRGAASYASR